MPEISNATLLVGCTHQDEQEQIGFDSLAATLSARLGQPVIPFPIDQPSQSLTDILSDLMRHGIGRIITLPIFLSPAEYERYAVEGTVARANRRWPFVQHHVARPLDWDDWLGLLGAELRGFENPVALPQDETAVILTGHGDAGPDANGDLAKLARLFYEKHDYGWVDVAFVNGAGPSVANLIAQHHSFGARRIIVTPYMLFTGRAQRELATQVKRAGANSQLSSDNSQFTITLVDLLLARHQAALDDHSLLPPSWEEIEAQVAADQEAREKGRAGRTKTGTGEYEQMKSRIDAILPPRYQGRSDEVSAAPMAAADLLFDDDGAVLWDQIFGVDDPNNPYCELALAGGPSHRGELLEAVNGAACLAEPGKYATVLDEIGRGIGLITGLSVVESKAPGWIGVQCDSEEMAIWLLRAIIVENVMVRREGDVIYLPAAPHYTLKDQIKSLVTVTAKTWHYWIEHITYQELFKAARVSTDETA